MPPIQIHITAEMVLKVKAFSEDVLHQTYNRFDKSELIRFERIFVGKLGELCFSTYLNQKDMPHDITGMFAVYEGETNVDKFDFEIPSTGESIDVKTAYRSFHTRILIPSGINGQWNQMPKDYYVGLKIEGLVDANGHILPKLSKSLRAELYGYVPRTDSRWNGPQNLGEGPCMWVYLNKLDPIQKLLEKMMK